MHCKHCDGHIYYDVYVTDWIHSFTGDPQCIIDGNFVGTSATPNPNQTS